MPQEIKSIKKAIDLLTVFDHPNCEYSLRELCQKVELHKSSLHRILVTCERAGILRKDPRTKKYALGYKLFELGNLVTPAQDLKHHSERLLIELMEKTKENVNLVVQNGKEALYISRVQGPHKLQFIEEVGNRLPLHCTAVGKVLLAFSDMPERQEIIPRAKLPKLTRFTITDPKRLTQELANIRKRGFAVDNEEYEEGCRCIAAPIKNSAGQTIAALAISGPCSRISERRIRFLAKTVMEIALRVSHKFGYSVQH
jgi:IclR family KDG regulon transcriptional repressor